MPKVKDRAAAAPAARPVDDPDWNAGPAPAKATKRPAKKTAPVDDPSTDAPSTTATESDEPVVTGGPQSEAEPDEATQDWSRPDYADDPGEVEFGSMEEGDDYLSVMWYGPEGTGKTTDLCRMLELGPGKLLLVNAEGGAKRRALRFHGIDTSRIRTFPAPGQPLTFEGLERLYYRLAADLEADPDSWVGTGWDSATAIAQYFLDNIVEDDIRKTQEILQRNRRGKSGRAGNIELRDRFETDRDDYSTLAQQFRLLLRKYRQLPCHFGVTALMRRDEDKKTRTVTYGPAVSPALQNDLLGYVDIVIRTHAETGKDGSPVWWGRTSPTEDERGKDRLAGLPYELVDPTFDRIRDYLDGELNEDTDPVQHLLAGERVRRVRRSLSDDPPTPAEPTPDTSTEDLTAEPADDRHHTQDGTPDGPPLAGETDEDGPLKPPARRATKRKSPAEAKARAEVKADTDDKPPRRATKRAPAKSDSGGGFSGEPPF